MANAEVNMTLDASELKQVLDDFIQIDLPNAVREIVREELASEESTKLIGPIAYKVAKATLLQALGDAAAWDEFK